MADAHVAREAVEAAEDQLVQVRERYHVAIRQLAADGMSLRDIARELGLSHQRVHQIVSGAATKPAEPKRRRRITGVAAVVLVAALAASGVGLVVHRDAEQSDPPPVAPQDPPPAPDVPRDDTPAPQVPPDYPWNGPPGGEPYEPPRLCPDGSSMVPEACIEPYVIPLG